MKRISVLKALQKLIVAFSIGCGFGMYAFATVPSVSITVPKKGTLEISKLKVSVSIATDNPVTFQITNSRYNTVTTLSLSPGSTPCFADTSFAPCGVLLLPQPGGSNGPATVFVAPPDNGIPAGDPGRRRYIFVFNLDDNINTANNACPSTDVGDETFTITVTAGPQIDGICAESLQPDVTGAGCNNLQVVPVPQAAGIATVGGIPPNSNLQGCRVGVDVMMVLDRSGSMASSVGDAATPKITALHTAVNSFVTAWDTMRKNESKLSASPSVISPADKVGMVYFDNNIFALHQLVAASSTNDTLLHLFDSVKADFIANDPSVTPGGSTSIGGGLLTAANSFSAAPAAGDGNRNVILLMSDGMQNTNPMAQVSGSQVQTTNGGPPANLPNQPPLQIYSVTVGTGLAVDPTINQNLATAANGFYVNTETDAGKLPTFFLELLQNFIKYSTVETLRIAQAPVGSATPFQATIPVTSTTQSLIFHVNWPAPPQGVISAAPRPAQSGPRLVEVKSGPDVMSSPVFQPTGPTLRLTVTPPGGGAPLVQTTTDPTLLLNQVLPISPSTNPAGDWGVKIEILNAGTTTFPVNLVVLGDDEGLNSELITVTADYVTGDKIRVQAKVNELGKRILGLGTNPGDKMLVQLLSPAQSLGDLLSDSNASSVPPVSPDPLSPAEAKLANFLQSNPGALNPASNVLVLKDVANNGIYSAEFPSQISGHYNFLFALEGKTQNLGRFSRQQLKTVYVRPAPDNSSTQYSTSIVGGGGHAGQTLTINMTPKTKFGNRLGPGWANYFWFVAPGQAPVKPVDNLNGTYTATMPFTGTPVIVHFLGGSGVVIPDTTTGNTLPVPLGGNNTVGNVPGLAQTGKYAVFVDLGGAFPNGTLANAVNAGFSLNGGLEYIFNPHVSAEGILGYHHFPGKIGGDVNVFQFSADIKFYLTNTWPVRPFVNGGIGGYHFNNIGTNFGGNVGAGVLKEFANAPHWGIQASYNFHAVNTPGATAQFSTVQGGVRYVF